MIVVRLLFVLCLTLSTTLCHSAERPNILFVLTEDQGAHLSLLGTPGLKTPHVDALAKSGTYFSNAFVAYPVCSASKAAIFTGLHNHTNGILNNTHNFHKPADQVTAAERGLKLARTNRIHGELKTLTEILKANGYYQGVTHKLHVLPNEKFPYDEFLKGSRAELVDFIRNAKAHKQPWFLMVNIPNSHRPYPNSDKTPIRVNPDEVELPPYLPDSPEVRKDWAEYLAGIEQADSLTGQALNVLEQSGSSDNTIVVFMSDHGPTFQHGKMTLYDLGLRVPLIVRGPGIAQQANCDELVSELDLLPTILDLCGIDSSFDYPLHGKSITGLLKGDKDATGHEYLFAEISNRGPLPNNGMQERCVFDGRWKLIYRENVETGWRQVNADSRQFEVWGNRTYAETIRLKDRFPKQYQILAEMVPQNLGGKVPRLELYDLENDPHEMRNLAGAEHVSEHKARLRRVLSEWVDRTNDSSIRNLSAVDLPETQSANDRQDERFPIARSKKGLQVEIAEDAVELGVQHAVFNLNLTRLLTTDSSPENPSWMKNGHQYHFDHSYLRQLDKDIKQLSDSGALVYLVVLVYRSNHSRDADVLLHPQYNLEAPNKLSAFNTVTPQGRAAFSAAMEFIADRWSGTNTDHGRVVGYIIGNEVNSHWWWSNRGEVPMNEFVEDYADAMTLAHQAVRTASDWARIYVSLEHHWNIRFSKNNPLRSFPAKPFLERFAAAMQERGDAQWHLAFHPYPEDLFDPSFWEDQSATPNADTPRITPKNLEVLTAFMRTPEMLLDGEPRSIILSEQGFHSSNETEGELLQAAAYCYAYRKIAALEDIDAFILHRHVDHPHEGGLNLGLRRYAPGNRRSPPKKMIYDVFRDADRDNWQTTFEFALPIVGLKKWP